MNLSRYPAHKSSRVTWLGDIAEDWDVRPIKYLVITPVTDGPHATPDILSEGIPFVSAEAINHGKINFDKIRGHIAEEDHNLFSKKYKPQRGDIYLVKSGATTGRLAIVETDVEFNIWSPLAAIRCDPEIIDRYFLFFYMHSKEFQTGIELSWSFGTQQNIGMGVIENLDVPIPSLAEQQQIAAFLDWKTGQIDALMARKKELLEKLKEKRLAVITQAVTRGLNPAAPLRDSGIPWLGHVPEHWEVRRLKFTASERLQYGANEAAELDDLDCPRYIRITDIKEDGTLHEDTFRSLPPEVAEPFLLEDGDLLLARSGATVGKSFQYLQTWGQAAYAGYLIRFRVEPKVLTARFGYYFLRSQLYWAFINSSLIQATIQNFSAEKYASINVPLPPLDEQVAIVAELEKQKTQTDKLEEAITQAIARLTEYRTALITAATTGKIDVRGVKIPQQPEQP